MYETHPRFGEREEELGYAVPFVAPLVYRTDWRWNAFFFIFNS